MIDAASLSKHAKISPDHWCRASPGNVSGLFMQVKNIAHKYLYDCVVINLWKKPLLLETEFNVFRCINAEILPPIWIRSLKK